MVLSASIPCGTLREFPVPLSFSCRNVFHPDRVRDHPAAPHLLALLRPHTGHPVLCGLDSLSSCYLAGVPGVLLPPAFSPYTLKSVLQMTSLGSPLPSHILTPEEKENPPRNPTIHSRAFRALSSPEKGKSTSLLPTQTAMSSPRMLLKTAQVKRSRTLSSTACSFSSFTFLRPSMLIMAKVMVLPVRCAHLTSRGSHFSKKPQWAWKFARWSWMKEHFRHRTMSPILRKRKESKEDAGGRKETKAMPRLKTASPKKRMGYRAFPSEVPCLRHRRHQGVPPGYRGGGLGCFGRVFPL